jgi:hypothetical protein
MKKIGLSLLVMIMALELSACGNAESSSGTNIFSKAEQQNSVVTTMDSSSEAVIETSSSDITVTTVIELSESDKSQTQPPETSLTEENSMFNIQITVGGQIFSAKLYDNESSKKLVEMLPLTLDMNELHGNEKYYYLDSNLPTDSESVEYINSGDIMLYGSDCLVLFYDSFSSVYSYTRLGYVENPDGLAKALGSGNVTVTLSL